MTRIACPPAPTPRLVSLAMLCGSSLHDNSATQGGGAIFYVSNDRTGTMSITDSLLQANPSSQFESAGLPGIFVLAAPGQPVVTRSTISK